MKIPAIQPRSALLFGTAVFALVWAVVRAAVQSIVIDEADTYLAFVAPNQPFHWYPAANNHILNSMLMRLSTAIFGVTHLSVRAPALLGAAIYIAAACALCRLITDDAVLRWCVLVCLVYNPFVFDYFVAARGYGLANAFLLGAIALVAYSCLTKTAAVASLLCRSSICLGLTIASNFSFAVAAIAMAALAYLLNAAGRPWRERGRLALASFVPMALVVLFFCGYTAPRFPKSELVFGAGSLHATLRSVAADSLYEPNPDVLNPSLLAAAQAIQPWLFPALRWISLGCAIIVAFHWRRGLDEKPNRLAILTAGIAVLIGCTLAVHWILFRFEHVLLPQDRTALYLASLGAAVAGLLASLSLSLPGRARLAGRILTGVLGCFALSFLFSLRLSYFKEWQYDADVSDAYRVLADFHRKSGVTHIVSNWRYSSALNFYRDASGIDIDPIQGTIGAYPPGQPVYVVYLPDDDAFVGESGLAILFRGKRTSLAIAVRPRVSGNP